MPSLKDLKIRIGSVKNTQKITKAMKMVAAAKLRRAKEQAEASRPYAESLEIMLRSVTSTLDNDTALPPLLSGTGQQQRHLIIVATADRGLCGGFNSSIVKEAKTVISRMKSQNKEVFVFCLGKKGYEQLHSVCEHNIVEHMQELYKTRPDFSHAQHVSETIQQLIKEYDIDVCHIIYNHFKSAISQIVTTQQLMPMLVPNDPLEEMLGDNHNAVYEFEPDKAEILQDMVPRNLSVQVYKAMLENAASEQGARMTAMDNATRNAGDMMKSLTLQYNRTRQAAITKELIEIISGAEAL